MIFRHFLAATLTAVLALGGVARASDIRDAGAHSGHVQRSGDFRIEFGGRYDAKYAALDEYVEAWMQSNNIHAAQLAFRQAGVLEFSHAYTMGPGRLYPTTETTNVMRLASVSKMMATAAITTLYAQKVLNGNTRVFHYLGITKPLFKDETPDPNIDKITIQELVDHTSGLHGEGSYDPLFTMRDEEVRLGTEPLTKTQFARYVYGLPLQFVPGSQTLYSNVGYVLLGMVVEKATGMSFFDYMNSAIFAPLGLTNVALGASHYTERNPAEVIPDDPYTGPSVFDLGPHPPTRPFDYEGGDIIWENADSASDFETNAESVSLFIHTYNVYGLGGRQSDYARSGCVPGAATWAESLSNNVDFALLFNAQPCLGFTSSVIENLDKALNRL